MNKKSTMLIISLLVIIVLLVGAIVIVIQKNNKDAYANYSDSDFVRNTSVTMIDEDGMDKHAITAKIVSGNIELSYNGKKVTLKTVNAKYLYEYAFMSYTNEYLFYITEDGKLYAIESANSLVSDEYNNLDEIDVTSLENLLFQISDDSDKILEFFEIKSNEVYVLDSTGTKKSYKYLEF